MRRFLKKSKITRHISRVIVHTGNGHGSSSTAIRRFTTVLTSIGKAITYADSSTLGGTFTINENGIYCVYYEDSGTTGSQEAGITVNSTQLTTSIAGVTLADKIGHLDIPTANRFGDTQNVVFLRAGDIVRAHTDTTLNAANTNVRFEIRKLVDL